MKEAARPDSSSSPADGQLPPWEKVLWKQQPYPDNYIPDTFLQDMVRHSMS
jgi:phosphatidylinositol glycan class C protein